MMIGNWENILYDVIFYMHAYLKMNVTRTPLLEKSSNLAIEHGIQEFKGYSSWATPLLQRFKLSCQRKMDLMTLTDYQLIQREVEYMTFLITILPEIAPGKKLLMEKL